MHSSVPHIGAPSSVTVLPIHPEPAADLVCVSDCPTRLAEGHVQEEGHWGQRTHSHPLKPTTLQHADYSCMVEE